MRLRGRVRVGVTKSVELVLVLKMSSVSRVEPTRFGKQALSKQQIRNEEG